MPQASRVALAHLLTESEAASTGTSTSTLTLTLSPRWEDAFEEIFVAGVRLLDAFWAAECLVTG
jgi:hypothetical protein